MDQGKAPRSRGGTRGAQFAEFSLVAVVLLMATFGVINGTLALVASTMGRHAGEEGLSLALSDPRLNAAVRGNGGSLADESGASPGQSLESDIRGEVQQFLGAIPGFGRIVTHTSTSVTFPALSSDGRSVAELLRTEPVTVCVDLVFSFVGLGSLSPKLPIKSCAAGLAEQRPDPTFPLVRDCNGNLLGSPDFFQQPCECQSGQGWHASSRKCNTCATNYTQVGFGQLGENEVFSADGSFNGVAAQALGIMCVNPATGDTTACTTPGAIPRKDGTSGCYCRTDAGCTAFLGGSAYSIGRIYWEGSRAGDRRDGCSCQCHHNLGTEMRMRDHDNNPSTPDVPRCECTVVTLTLPPSLSEGGTPVTKDIQRIVNLTTGQCECPAYASADGSWSGGALTSAQCAQISPLLTSRGATKCGCECDTSKGCGQIGRDSNDPALSFLPPSGYNRYSPLTGPEGTSIEERVSGACESCGCWRQDGRLSTTKTYNPSTRRCECAIAACPSGQVVSHVRSNGSVVMSGSSPSTTPNGEWTECGCRCNINCAEVPGGNPAYSYPSPVNGVCPQPESFCRDGAG